MSLSVNGSVGTVVYILLLAHHTLRRLQDYYKTGGYIKTERSEAGAPVYHDPNKNEDLWCQRLPWYEPNFPLGVLWKIGVLGKPSCVFTSMPSDGSWPHETSWEEDKHLKIESSKGPGN